MAPKGRRRAGLQAAPQGERRLPEQCHERNAVGPLKCKYLSASTIASKQCTIGPAAVHKFSFACQIAQTAEACCEQMKCGMPSWKGAHTCRASGVS